MLDLFLQFMAKYGDIIRVEIVEDAYSLEVQDSYFNRDQFIRKFSAYDFQWLDSDNESFRVKIDDGEYTITVSDIELEEQIEI